MRKKYIYSITQHIRKFKYIAYTLMERLKKRCLKFFWENKKINKIKAQLKLYHQHFSKKIIESRQLFDSNETKIKQKDLKNCIYNY